MSEIHEPPSEQEPSSSTTRLDLARELRDLGQQLEQSLRGVVESEQAKNLQRNLLAGLRELSTQMQTGLNSLKENPHVQNLAERGQQAVTHAQESAAAREFQEALARGVAFLKEQLASFNARQKRQEATPADSAAQRLTIEHEDSSTTGETIRLDPDQQDGTASNLE